MLKRIAAVFTVLLLLGVSTASAQDNRTVFWQRWDVEITDVYTTENRFNVTEIYDVQFGGTFRFGSAVIPLERTGGISDVYVSVAGQQLRESCSGQSGTYCLDYSDDELSVTYYFFQSVTNTTVHIEIAYTVLDALRIYPDGDQLWWSAIPPEHYGFPIGSSTITVEMPPGFAPREGVDPVVTYGAPGDVQVNGTRIVARATRQIGGNEAFEIRVQYPHDPNAAPASWQSNFDQTRAFEENTLPLLSLGVIAVSLIIGIGGTLFFYSMYMRKGRDPVIGVVPTYLSEPPSDLPPAVVGTLVDERADQRDAISTIIDLAHKGYMAIEETQNEGVLGFGRSSSFTFKRSDKPLSDLRGFEQKMMNKLFGGDRMERTMDSLRYTFYTTIAEIQGDLYRELVTEGLFETNPDSTRNGWSALSIIILAIAGVVGFALFSLAERYSYVLLLLPIAIGVVGVAAMIVGPAMPAKTRKGAEEAAKWKAFYEYLRNLEKYTQVEEATSQFERYLPYAVAFGLEKTWIGTFTRVPTMPIPYWYYPTYGPYRRGYIPGTPMPGGYGNGGGLPGGLATAGGGNALDNLSGGLAGGLESISSGLSSMLDSAASTLTSRPQSASSSSSGSWRSGGSSFSGGGFSGGGGSGGGSRGFG
jgi:uncharacterized membrane protein YgcG